MNKTLIMGLVSITMLTGIISSLELYGMNEEEIRERLLLLEKYGGVGQENEIFKKLFPLLSGTEVELIKTVFSYWSATNDYSFAIARQSSNVDYKKFYRSTTSLYSARISSIGKGKKHYYYW